MNTAVSNYRQRSVSKRTGFTIVEVLLVIVIIGMTSVMLMGAHIQAMQTARMRTAARYIQTLNTHARNIAILRQVHTQVKYDSEANTIEVLELKQQRGAGAMQVALGIDIGPTDNLMYDEDETAAEREERLASAGGTTIEKKTLPEGIKIVDFESGTDLWEDEVFRVDYWPTGYAQGHLLYLEDPKREEDSGYRKRFKIEIENVTGHVTVTEEEKW